jgi:hypothetical protein
MKRSIGIFSAVALSSALGAVLSAGTGALPASATTSCAGVISEADVSPPPGYVQVINAEMTVTDDEDSGFVGYWALDDYTKHIQVWEDPSGTEFYVAVLYQGTWHTFAGARSPEAGITELSDGTGSIKGGYIATMTGQMASPVTAPKHGTIGSYNFGGTQSDILLGTYGNGQTGATSVVDWRKFYFTSSTISTFNYTDGGNAWGWRYVGNTTTGPWCNTGLTPGGSGDIVTH